MPKLLFFSLLLFSGAGMAQRRVEHRNCPYTFEMHKDGGEQDIGYASSLRLNRKDTAVRTLLIYIHGLLRNALGCFENAQIATQSARQRKTTLVISPNFVNEEDYPAGGDLCWKRAEWKDGYESISSERKHQKVGMSSYEVMDSLVTAVLGSGNFPNITKVVIAGHSAGGQFVDRYSATTPIPDLYPAVRFRFLVMNPSSYLYPDNARPAGDGNFVVPDSTGCEGYNRYPKGLTALNTYAAAAGTDRIVHNIMQRDIVILVGDEDIRMDDPELDVSCAANLQGKFRLERGLYYMARISSYPEYGNKKNYAVVHGYHHESDIIASGEAIKWIFSQ